MRDSRGGQSKHHHANVWLVLLAEVGRPNAEDPWVASSLCARTAPSKPPSLLKPGRKAYNSTCLVHVNVRL